MNVCRLATGFGLAFLIGGAASALADGPAKPQRNVPEPPGLWRGPMHGETPKTVQGASVITADQLARLLEKEHPAMIDVANVDRQPPSMKKGMPWAPLHASIPGATWMPGAGNGTSDHDFEAAFAKRAAVLTGGDKDKPIVTFCHPQRWGSYNAAKRLASLGYRRVYWLPNGVEGWSDAHATAKVDPDPAWKTAVPDAATRQPD